MSIVNISSENLQNGIDTDFTVKLKKPLMRAIGLQLLNVSIPLTYHTVADGENIVRFSIDVKQTNVLHSNYNPSGGSDANQTNQMEAILAPGNYSPAELVDELQRALNYAISLATVQDAQYVFKGLIKNLPAEFQPAHSNTVTSQNVTAGDLDITDATSTPHGQGATGGGGSATQNTELTVTGGLSGDFARFVANSTTNMWKHQVRVHRRNRTQKLDVRESFGEYPVTANDAETNLSTFARFEEGGRSGSDIPASLTDLYYAKGGTYAYKNTLSAFSANKFKDPNGNDIGAGDIEFQPIGIDYSYTNATGVEGFNNTARDGNVKLVYSGSYANSTTANTTDPRVFPELYTPGLLVMYDKDEDDVDNNTVPTGQFVFSNGDHLTWDNFTLHGYNPTAQDVLNNPLLPNSMRILKLLGFNFKNTLSTSAISRTQTTASGGTGTNPRFKFDKLLENVLYSQIQPEISGPSVLYLRLGGDILLDQQNTETSNNDRIPIPLDQPHGSVVHYENSDKADLIPFSVPCDVSTIKIKLEAGDTNEVIGGNTGLRGHHFYARIKFYFAHQGGARNN